jgi:hypothetical protein
MFSGEMIALGEKGALGVLIATIVSFSAVISSSDLISRRSDSQDGGAGAIPTTMATTHTAIPTPAMDRHSIISIGTS